MRLVCKHTYIKTLGKIVGSMPIPKLIEPPTYSHKMLHSYQNQDSISAYIGARPIYTYGLRYLLCTIATDEWIIQAFINIITATTVGITFITTFTGTISKIFQ